MTVSTRRLIMGRHSKSESDVDDDSRVGDSRAGRHFDSSYVGRTAPEDDFGARPTRAEAGSQEG
jgi:hypothetical protein